MKRLLASRRVAWLVGFCLLGGVWVSSSQTYALQIALSSFDKIVHTTVYAAIGFLFARASLMTWERKQRLRVAAIGALIGIAFGLSDELHQAFVPGRTASAEDLLADLIGSCAGAALYLALSQRQKPPHAAHEPTETR